MSTQIDNKVTTIEMVISLAAMYGLYYYVDWIPLEKKAIMIGVYGFLVLIQGLIFILNFDKGTKKSIMFFAMIFPIVISIIWIYFRTISGDTNAVKEGIGAIFTVVTTPHPYELGWVLVKSFFTSSINGDS